MKNAKSLGIAIIFILVVAIISVSFFQKWRNEPYIVVCSYGGAFQDAQRKAYFEPFEKLTGIKVIEAKYGGEYAKLRAMVESKKVIWDVVDVETSVLLRGTNEGILEPLNYNSIDSNGFMEGAIHTHGIVTDFFSTVISYDKRVFPDSQQAPRSWKDFWDVQRFPGQRSLRRNPRSTLEAALLADGVNKDSLYPLDVERAFKSLNRIKNDVKVFWESGQQPVQLLSDREVVMASSFSGRIWKAAIIDKQPLRIEWNEGIMDPEWWIIPKGTPRRDLAMKFIAFASRPDIQANLTKYIAYGPANTQAMRYVDSSIIRDLPTWPDNLKKQIRIDGEWWAKNEQAILERFNGWLMAR